MNIFLELKMIYKTLILNNYRFIFPNNTVYEKYSTESYCGIIFHINNYRYDIVNNYVMGFRLIINDLDGGWKDIPFKKATFGFLPDIIEVTEL
jgi:hypothetical protein